MKVNYVPGHVDALLTDAIALQAKKRIILDSHTVDVTTECWNWTKMVSDRGRALIKVGRRNHHAARVAYVVFKELSVGSEQVCHSCDNVLCVNPDHLWLGTHKDNMKDMSLKGRRDGELNPKCKLSEEDIKVIRELHRCGSSMRSLARKFKVSKTHIGRIARNESWDHL
jgi:hypothetical protein